MGVRSKGSPVRHAAPHNKLLRLTQMDLYATLDCVVARRYCFYVTKETTYE